MPNYKDHLAGGAIAFACVLVAVTPYKHPVLLTTTEWLLCSLAGSLFPDIDIKSKGQKYFYFMILITLITLLATRNFTLFAIISIIALIPLLTKHRGLFHRTWLIIGLPLLVWHITTIKYSILRELLFYDTIFFIAGALSHLWLDLGLRKMLRW